MFDLIKKLPTGYLGIFMNHLRPHRFFSLFSGIKWDVLNTVKMKCGYYTISVIYDTVRKVAITPK